ncbi:hypothetical protein EVAR_23865_1 [Eumeta japonica]|uniref:Uncharacterized protein n=1 Tax=Eumeta variegata TaxID=151549 RepID=A0A4C1V5B3_EUMVA|nr:hypothetical protein EVAR_23865_1 [Eumeta japonica]
MDTRNLTAVLFRRDRISFGVEIDGPVMDTKFHLDLSLRQIGGGSLTLGGGDGFDPLAEEFLTLTVDCFGAAIVVFVNERAGEAGDSL